VENFDQIRGEERTPLLERFKRDRNVMRMHILDRDYERLTIVIGTGVRGGVPSFRIDHPQGFSEVSAGIPEWRMFFETSSPDGILFRFKTLGGEISGEEIWIPYPDRIERRQRRKDFRLQAPAGTVMRFTVQSIPHETSVINISTGGALLALNKGDLSISVGRRVKNLAFLFPSGKGQRQIRVKEAEIRRLNRDSTTGKTHCALQFTGIEPVEKSALNDLIYHFQRVFPRKIRLLDAWE
jgi:hypothetical protein